MAPVSTTAYPSTKNPAKWVVRLLRSMIGWRKSKKIIRDTIYKYRIDIVHTNIGPMNLAPSVCRKVGIPHVWHIREFQPELFIKYFPCSSQFEKDIKQRGNYCIAITETLFDFYSLRQDKDRVFYDGVLSKSYEHVEQKSNFNRDKVILSVGRVEEVKGTLDLVKAFVQFHRIHPEWKLRIVGEYSKESSYFLACKNYCEDLEKKKIVTFEGKRRDVYELMRNARIFVMASTREGFGFVTVEAMANGCFVIGRNTAGTKEQFDNGYKFTGEEIALRFETNEELMQQLNNAAENDHSDMIERARRTAIELYSLEKTSEQVDNYYNWILKNYQYEKKSKSNSNILTPIPPDTRK